MKTPDRPLYDPEGEGKSSYARALAAASEPVPYERVDWDVFHARLAARAELSLARLRHPHRAPRPLLRATTGRAKAVPAARTWWQHTARWSPLIVSASVAAGIALIIVVRVSPKESVDAVVASASPSVEQRDRTRAVFESAALGRGTRWTIESALLPSTTELLIPLGRGATSQ
jgi:hypothetical protein